MTSSVAPFLNDNIDLASASLIASDGSQIKIQYSIADLSIKENMFIQCMTASMTILDGLGLIDKLPIVGEEFFSLRFRTPGTGNVYFTKLFAVYSITNRKKSDDKLEMYTLNMISLEGMIDTLTTVNKNYVGLRYDEIAKKVFEDFILGSKLKGGLKKDDIYMDLPKIKKTIGVDRTSGLQSLTTVGDTPFKIIKRCARLAQSDDYPDADFIFYEDRDGFNFVAISSLLEQDPVFQVYTMGDQGIEETRPDELKKGKFRYDLVREFEYNKGPDTIKSSHSGMYGNKIFAFDPILKKRSTITNNYITIQKEKKIPSFKTLDSNNLVSDKSIHSNDSGASHTQYYINNIFDKNYEEVDYMKSRIRQDTDRHLFHHDDSYRSRGRTAMKFSLLDNYTFTIAVGGNSNLKVGEILNVEIPLSSDLEEDKLQPYSHLFGNKKSNKFLITGLTHNFIGTAGRYFTYITLAKDSYFNDINTKYAGKI